VPARRCGHPDRGQELAGRCGRVGQPLPAGGDHGGDPLGGQVEQPGGRDHVGAEPGSAGLGHEQGRRPVGRRVVVEGRRRAQGVAPADRRGPLPQGPPGPRGGLPGQPHGQHRPRLPGREAPPAGPGRRRRQPHRPRRHLVGQGQLPPLQGQHDPRIATRVPLQPGVHGAVGTPDPGRVQPFQDQRVQVGDVVGPDPLADDQLPLPGGRSGRRSSGRRRGPRTPGGPRAGAGGR
jgi:hypothetical protein